jgi:hypothetical protein
MAYYPSYEVEFYSNENARALPVDIGTNAYSFYQYVCPNSYLSFEQETPSSPAPPPTVNPAIGNTRVPVIR